MDNNLFSKKVFISYARQDIETVEELYQNLLDVGFEPWMDTKNILAGEDWKLALKKATREAPFFLACLSKNSVNKRGIIQVEIKEALTVWEEKLQSDIYLIPVRLDKCRVPDSLTRFQWLDLFENDGFDKLLQTLNNGMRRLTEGKQNSHEVKAKNELSLGLTPDINLFSIRNRISHFIIGFVVSLIYLTGAIRIRDFLYALINIKNDFLLNMLLLVCLLFAPLLMYLVAVLLKKFFSE